MQIYSQKDVDKKALKGARIAVLGYGSQGRAHALNLKDSGFDVVVGVRKSGASWAKARPSLYSSSVIHLRLSTRSWCIYPTRATGPPKPVAPSFRK